MIKLLRNDAGMPGSLIKVFVYKNLHKHCFSVKALEGPQKGRVIAHTDNVQLCDVEPRVSESGRQRVLVEKRKNVHAGLTGYWIIPDKTRSHEYTVAFDFEKQGAELTYNPYLYETFVFKPSQYSATSESEDLLRFSKAKAAHLTTGKSFTKILVI